MSNVQPLNLHKVEIRMKPGAELQVPTGANTEVLIDGEPLRYCTELNFNVTAGRVAELTIKLLAHVEVNVIGKLETQVARLVIDGE